jgi:hypothetical protein
MRAALEQGRWTFVPPLGHLNRDEEILMRS